jgi:hypothetical protein
MRFVLGAFFVLHGMVFLLYAGQSWRLFELVPGMVWPDASWAFSKLLGDGATRAVATIAFVLTAAGFAAGAIGIFARQSWWHPVVVVAAAFSAVCIILFWDGGMQKLADKGGVGLLINLAILVLLLVLKWPSLGF